MGALLLLPAPVGGELSFSWPAQLELTQRFQVIVHETSWKMNKQLWSPAYVFLMAGCTGIVIRCFRLDLSYVGLCLVLFYLLIDFTVWQPDWMRRKYFGTHINITVGTLFHYFVNIATAPALCLGGNEHNIYLPHVPSWGCVHLSPGEKRTFEHCKW